MKYIFMARKKTRNRRVRWLLILYTFFDRDGIELHVQGFMTQANAKENMCTPAICDVISTSPHSFEEHGKKNSRPKNQPRYSLFAQQAETGSYSNICERQPRRVEDQFDSGHSLLMVSSRSNKAFHSGATDKHKTGEKSHRRL